MLRILSIIFAVLLIGSSSYGNSDRELQRIYRQEMNLLMKRTEDYRRLKRQEAQEERRKLAGVQAYKLDRQREIERAEKARLAYISKREKKKKVDEEDLEAEFNRLLEEENRKRDLARRRYIKVQRLLQEAVNKGNGIPEGEEFGLY